MKRFIFALEELKKIGKKSRRGGGTTCGGEATFPLGFGTFYEALDIVTPEGLGEVYNAFVEVMCGIAQGLWSVSYLRHPELVSGSQTHPSPPLQKEGVKLHPSPLVGEGRISMRVLRALEIRVRGAMHVVLLNNIGQIPLSWERGRGEGKKIRYIKIIKE